MLVVLCVRSLEPCPGDHSNMEYTKQLLLSCLLNVCNKLSPDGRAVAAGRSNIIYVTARIQNASSCRRSAPVVYASPQQGVGRKVLMT